MPEDQKEEPKSYEIFHRGYEEGYRRGHQEGREEYEEFRKQELASMAQKLDAMSAMLGDQFTWTQTEVPVDFLRIYTLQVRISRVFVDRCDRVELLRSMLETMQRLVVDALLKNTGGEDRRRANRLPMRAFVEKHGS